MNEGIKKIKGIDKINNQLRIEHDKFETIILKIPDYCGYNGVCPFITAELMNLTLDLDDYYIISSDKFVFICFQLCKHFIKQDIPSLLIWKGEKKDGI